MTLNRKKLAIITFPLSLVYGLAVGIRNRLFDGNILKSKWFDIPVISVGNITVGGTGKTPHIEYLVRLLHKDYRIATLSRGYKRKTRDFILATGNSSVDDIGDESRQLKQKFPDILVAVDRKRVNGIKKLKQKEKHLDAVLLDDAYQHRYVKPGMSILLVDYTKPVFSDYLLPFGNLRESKHETRRADIIIVTKFPEKINPLEKKIFIKDLNVLPYQFLYFTKYVYNNPEPVFKINENKNPDYKQIKNYKSSILLVTGIARPQPIVKFLGNYSDNIMEMKFPDHHKYTISDMKKIEERFARLSTKTKYIFTTEKDSARFREIKNTDMEICSFMYYIPVEVKFLDEGAKKFNKDIIAYVKHNRKVNKLYK
jgi:tetraacyldisaccharide 4'-kinase